MGYFGLAGPPGRLLGWEPISGLIPVSFPGPEGCLKGCSPWLQGQEGQSLVDPYFSYSHSIIYSHGTAYYVSYALTDSM